MAQLTVDLSADKATLARIAQLILQFAGYEPPKVYGPPGEEVTFMPLSEQPGAPAPQAVVTHPLLAPFADIEQAAAPTSAPSPAPNDEDPHVMSALNAAQVFAPPPAVIPPPPPPPAAGIDVDARGLPWDARIHASTRAKTADGNWRQKRGVDLILLEKVEDELRGVMGLPVPAAPPVPPAPPVSVQPPVPEVPQVPPPPSAGSVAPPAPPSTGTPSVPVSAGAATTASPGNPTFPQLMQAITKAFTGGALNQQQIAVAVQKVGLPALPHLASRQDLVGAVATELGLAL